MESAKKKCKKSGCLKSYQEKAGVRVLRVLNPKKETQKRGVQALLTNNGCPDSQILPFHKRFAQAHILHEEIQPLTPDEVQVFLEAATRHDARKRYNDVPDYFPLFLAAIHTGMRVGELAGLQWSDVDWHGKFIQVRRSVKGGRIHPPKTKAGKRKIDLSDCLLQELDSLKRRRREEWMRRGKGEILEWVFCNSDGNILDTGNVTKRHFHKCLQDAKLRQIRFHDLRHTFASLLIQNGESLTYAKEQMGHSSIKVTVDVYGHLVPGANRQAMNRLPVPKSATQAQPAKNEAGDGSERNSLKAVSGWNSGV